MKPFDRPIIILAAPRSGSTLLFETLASSKNLWTIGGESHAVIEQIPEFSTVHRGFVSNALTEEDGDDASISLLKNRFVSQLRNADEAAYNPAVNGNIRFLEKTPKNSLRIRFLNKVFPDAKFIYLLRDPRENISSLIDGWRSGRFRTYPNLPGFGGHWSYLLTPEWQKLRQSPFQAIATDQWRQCNQTIIKDLKELPSERWTMLNYQNLLNDTENQVKRLCHFMDLDYDAKLQQRCQSSLPNSQFTLSQPQADKWFKNRDSMAPHLKSLSSLVEKVNDLARLHEQNPVSNHAYES